jgi:hypothetical protein
LRTRTVGFISLGTGFSAVPISDHKFLLIRVRRWVWQRVELRAPDTQDRLLVYDTKTNHESVLFEKPLSNRMIPHDAACAYAVGPMRSALDRAMQISHSSSQVSYSFHVMPFTPGTAEPPAICRIEQDVTGGASRVMLRTERGCS